MSTGTPRRRRTVGVIAAGVALVVALATAAAVWSVRGSEPVATELALTGDLRTHDPALVAGDPDGDPSWYVFSTGDVRVGLGSIQIRRSDDGLHWEDAGTVWDAGTRPEWVYDVVPGVENFWAPELYQHDGTWYLYYAASTFGSNRSVIGLMTSPTLDPDDPAYGWEDQGEVWRSVPGETDYNAIDPGIVEDEDGTPWMAFGSFWGGIQLVELEWPSGKPADPQAEPITIADRVAPPNAVEAPYLVHRDGWYYLFVSRDSCCQGTDSTYNMAVGRSRDVTGPYVDRAGTPMTEDGGETLLETHGDQIGPGGQSVSGGYLAYHYYAESLGGDFQLSLRELAWDDDGWPVATTSSD
ncbi:arabinan endo-1,5-alpha-L-arabinosidase [Oerskovia flava]|uniref:arabinan endo-1,5-alpha-L-arabinosidase n=1 Tax=Oerskovia flava TaxID=2986422 RepID=UPI002240686E|nr:arabinan endo-1,5-alpha-L-arabinosidase [Oerskovia sp. JB1-3-2]